MLTTTSILQESHPIDELESRDYKLTPLPSTSSIPVFNQSTPLTPVICDERAIAKLLEALLSKSGLSVGEAARRLGVTTNALRQYLAGRRTRPSLLWFVRIAELCGARVMIEFPRKR